MMSTNADTYSSTKNFTSYSYFPLVMVWTIGISSFTVSSSPVNEDITVIDITETKIKIPNISFSENERGWASVIK